MRHDHLTSERDLACSSSKLRASFVVFFSLIAGLIAQTSFTLMAQSQSPNVIGTWNVKITFANDEHRSLRFDMQDDGKGVFLLVDPSSKAWGSTNPSEAKWTKDQGNSVTFSGPIEFPIGNVGRDPGMLVFKGKFESPELITGDVEFSPSIGERPSKHGTFKALRGGG